MKTRAHTHTNLSASACRAQGLLVPREAVADPFTACVAFAEVAVGGLLLDRAHHSPGQFFD